MGLRVIGAGLPRTGSRSLKVALEHILGGRCYHMSEIPGHPFDLGDGWRAALAGGAFEAEGLLAGFAAAVDWPASMFWSELSRAEPDALVLLSSRDSSDAWWHSMEATVLPVARSSLAPGWDGGHDLIALLERFTGSTRWDDPDTLMSSYELHNANVRASATPERFLEWRPGDGWEPLCDVLSLPIPRQPFPWENRREDWG